MLEEIRRSKCFVDIGANCGLYTVIGCTINPQVRVVAIEPVAKICEALKNNISRNQYQMRTHVLNIALGDTNGTVPFHVAENALMGSLNTNGYQGQPGEIIQVECRTLDSIAEELNIEPDFLKIDVEGFEDVVLRGAQTVLRRFRPRIILEANPGDPCGEMNEILSAHGYEFSIITDGGPQPRKEIIPEPGFRNWLCIARDR